jgi:hypothetical protein
MPLAVGSKVLVTRRLGPQALATTEEMTELNPPTQVLIIALQNAVSPREIGNATASANFFRSLGGSAGIAIYGAIFASGLEHHLTTAVPSSINAKTLQATPAVVHGFPAILRAAVENAMSLAISHVFLVAAGVASAGFFVVLLLPERPLRKASAAAGPPPGQRPVGAGAGSDTETRPGGSHT